MSLRKLKRSTKNALKGYSESEVLIREATSNDSYGPDSATLRKLASMSSNSSNYRAILKILWSRLNDVQHIRHVSKSISVAAFLLRAGPDKFLSDLRKREDLLRSLCNFKYLVDGKDLGKGIRIAAEALLALMWDEDKLLDERSLQNKICSVDHRTSAHPHQRKSRYDEQIAVIAPPVTVALSSEVGSSVDDFFEDFESLSCEYDTPVVSPISNVGNYKPRRPSFENSIPRAFLHDSTSDELKFLDYLPAPGSQNNNHPEEFTALFDTIPTLTTQNDVVPSNIQHNTDRNVQPDIDSLTMALTNLDNLRDEPPAKQSTSISGGRKLNDIGQVYPYPQQQFVSPTSYHYITPQHVSHAADPLSQPFVSYGNGYKYTSYLQHQGNQSQYSYQYKSQNQSHS